MEKFLRDETGSLTLEWIFMLSLLVLGIAGGIASIRNAVILEAGADAGAAAGLNDSYTVTAPPTLSMNSKQSAIINGFECDMSTNKIKIDSTVREPKVIVLTDRMTDEVNEIVRKISETEPTMLAGFREDTVTVLDPEEIYRIYAANGKVFAVTG